MDKQGLGQQFQNVTSHACHISQANGHKSANLKASRLICLQRLQTACLHVKLRVIHCRSSCGRIISSASSDAVNVCRSEQVQCASRACSKISEKDSRVYNRADPETLSRVRRAFRVFAVLERCVWLCQYIQCVLRLPTRLDGLIRKRQLLQICISQLACTALPRCLSVLQLPTYSSRPSDFLWRNLFESLSRADFDASGLCSRLASHFAFGRPCQTATFDPAAHNLHDLSVDRPGRNELCRSLRSGFVHHWLL